MALPTVDQIAALIALQLGLDQVAPEALLVEDLGASSVELVGILATIEERWGVGLDETVFAEVSTVRQLAERVGEEGTEE